MTDSNNLKIPARKITRRSATTQKAECRRMKTEDRAFLTQAERTREGSTFAIPKVHQREESIVRMNTPSPPPEDDDLEDAERQKLDVDEIKKRLYQRECNKLRITPVGAFLRAPTRSHIAIRYYSLGSAGARALSVPLMMDSALTHLDLEGNAIGHEGLAHMLEMLMEHCALTHLNLKRNNLSSRGASLICKVLQTNRLIVNLIVAANEFKDKDGVVFANMLKVNRTLKSLDLSDNMLSHEAGQHLGEALSQNESLETLDLSWNQFREGGAAKLMDGVKENVSLKNLSLAFNAFNRGLCENPIDSLGSALLGNSTLKHLDVTNNRLGDLDIFMVAKSLRDNESLESLKIGDNLVSVRAAGALIKAVLVNESSGIKLLDMTDLTIAQSDLVDVAALEERGVKVIYGRVHQKETDFDSEPDPNRITRGEDEKESSENGSFGDENNGKAFEPDKRGLEEQIIVLGVKDGDKTVPREKNNKQVADEVDIEITRKKFDSDVEQIVDNEAEEDQDCKDAVVDENKKSAENEIIQQNTDEIIDEKDNDADEGQGIKRGDREKTERGGEDDTLIGNLPKQESENDESNDEKKDDDGSVDDKRKSAKGGLSEDEGPNDVTNSDELGNS